jgi:ATP-dependent DNA ligase
VCRSGEVRLWSRNGKDLTTKFPDVAAAIAAQVDVDCVIDGELIVWTGERLDFDALQDRTRNTAATVRRRLVAERPASYVVFDVLAVKDVDLRRFVWSRRRARLETLAAAWSPPLQLSPVTSDADEAKE